MKNVPFAKQGLELDFVFTGFAVCLKDSRCGDIGFVILLGCRFGARLLYKILDSTRLGGEWVDNLAHTCEWTCEWVDSQMLTGLGGLKSLALTWLLALNSLH